VVEITEDSRDSYLTIEFDTRLRSFAQFLKATADDGWLIASGKDIEGKLKIETSCAVGAPLRMKKDLEARLYTQGGNLLERRRPTLYCVPTCL
jgi:hypothetical protein